MFSDELRPPGRTSVGCRDVSKNMSQCGNGSFRQCTVSQDTATSYPGFHVSPCEQMELCLKTRNCVPEKPRELTHKRHRDGATKSAHKTIGHSPINRNKNTPELACSSQSAATVTSKQSKISHSGQPPRLTDKSRNRTDFSKQAGFTRTDGPEGKAGGCARLMCVWYKDRATESGGGQSLDSALQLSAPN